MKLRDYQQRALDSVVRELRASSSTLVVAPTGTGKTILFAGAIKISSKRCMVIAHREELLTQAADKIEAVTGDRPDIEQSILWANEGPFAKAKTVVASVQTLNGKLKRGRRMERFDPNEFCLLIIDEAHHAVSKTYRRVIDWFRKNKNLKVVGFTATPDRADKLAMGSVFETVAFDYRISEAIEDGWLVPIRNNIVTVNDLDFTNVRTTAGDLNKADLAAVMEFEQVLHGVAVPTLEIAKDRQSLVFAASVRQAERLSEIIDRYKPNSSSFVSGAMEQDQRRDVIRRFRDGRIQYLVNVGVATEGFDVPGVSCIVMARPTKSRSLYSQMVGRGTRPADGVLNGVDCPQKRKEIIRDSIKPDCLVIDFAGNSGRHRLVHAADILGGNEPDEVYERAHKLLEKGDVEDVSEAIVIAKTELEEEENERKRKRSSVRVDHVGYQSKESDPFKDLGIKPSSSKFLRGGRQLTGNQLAYLTRSGVNVEKFNPNELIVIHKEMVRRIKKNQCSLKQARILNKYGFDTKKMGFKEASGLLNRLASNGWKPL